MCRWLLDNKPDTKLIFTFANTGLEHEKTLEFVDRCDREWGLNVVWLEAIVNPEKGKGIRHKVVNFETASRKGEPFEAHIEKSGIPNKNYNQCSERLKQFVMDSYRRSLGFKPNHQTCIGIRSDEADRVSSKAPVFGLVYPLVNLPFATKEYIRHWWAEQPFDLDLPEHLGNCVTCWKKSDRKLLTIAKHEPERFEFFMDWEARFSHLGAFETIRDADGNEVGQKPTRRYFFRCNRSVAEVLAEARSPFKEFKDDMPPLQGGMFIDELDREEDCGSGCEIGGGV